MSKFEELIDLDRYPIQGTTADKIQFFAARCRRNYLQNSVLLLPDFLTRQGLERMAREARAAAPKSFRQVKQHTVYLSADDLEVSPDHPCRRRLQTTNSTVADCDIPSDAALRLLYDSPALRQFFATVIGKQNLYPYADPISPLNLGVTREGETLAWHFDKSDFAITLLLQQGQAGGEFEYVPRIRTEGEENYPAVARLLDGERTSVLTLNMHPGTLVMFQGRYSIHRVTEVEGNRDRLLAVLSYDERPQQRMSAFTQKTFYGRTA